MNIPMIGQAVGGNVSANITVRGAKNFIYEPRPGGEKSSVIARFTPSTSASSITLPVGQKVRRMFLNPSDRQMYIATNVGLYEQNGSQLVAFTAGDAKDAYFAANSTRIIVTDMDKVYLNEIGQALVQSVTTFNNCCGVGYLAGYFVALTEVESRLYYSQDGYTWEDLDFATVQQSSDWSVALRVHRDMLVLFGSSSIEFWQPTGDSNNPFAPITAVTANYGIRYASAVAEAGGALFFFGYDPKGDTSLYLLSGYEPVKVSNPDIDRIVQRSGLNEVRIDGFQINGRSYLGLYLFTGDGTSTWWLDIELMVWTEITNDSDLFGVGNFLQVDTTLYGASVDTNTIFSIQDYAGESDIPRTLTLDHLVSKDFDRFTVDSLRADVNGCSNIRLRVSRDGGETWGSYLSLTPAPPKRVQWNRLGTAREFTFEVSSTAAGQIELSNLYVNAVN